jgi:hypothetical protein
MTGPSCLALAAKRLLDTANHKIGLAAQPFN